MEVSTQERALNLVNAQHVQQGLFPKQRHFDRLFSEHFILYKPKDYVSGDFYWIGEKHNLRYLVVGDCTGHGVSASLTSVLALNLFEYSIMNKGIKRPRKILTEIDKRYIESFKDVDHGNFAHPWIDLSLICIDDAEGKIHFSSANRKLLIVRKDKEPEVYKVKGHPIGGWQIKGERNFETETIVFTPGDKIYLGSDGFQDQFGGPKDKKYGSKKLHALLTNNSNLPFQDQKQALEHELDAWTNGKAQTDDICIVSVEL